jgi:pimeloyl-ACP methyl ester carboxylesterase
MTTPLDTVPDRGRQVELRSGRRVHVVEAGEGPPGFGQSEPVRVPRERLRDAAVEFVDEILDALALKTPALAGNSMGGTWGLWHALARPARVRRLVLLGSAPLLPGTRPPVPLRVTAANLAELRAVISPFGFRPGARIDPDALRRLSVPALLIWGDRDPVGTVEVAQATARLMPQARLELLPAGHVPYLGHPERVAELVSAFVRSP